MPTISSTNQWLETGKSLLYIAILLFSAGIAIGTLNSNVADLRRMKEEHSKEIDQLKKVTDGLLERIRILEAKSKDRRERELLELLRRSLEAEKRNEQSQ